MIFIQAKALAGPLYIRAENVLAVQYGDREKCTIFMEGGAALPCTEAAAGIVARLEDALKGKSGEATSVLPVQSEAG
jgi:hypothetical protein